MDQQKVRGQLVELLPRLRRFAYGLTGSVDEGDDLVQSACEKALGRLDQYRPDTRLDSWMYRIVQTVWIDRRRARAARPETAVDTVDLEYLAVGDAARELDSRLELTAVQTAVAELPPDQRAVLMLVCVEGCSYKEAAETLEIPLGTVMSRLARARLAIGRAIEGAAPVGATARG